MKTLLLVEPDFLRRHIGVRRVILHYHQCLKNLNHIVDFAAPISGKLHLGTIVDPSKAPEIHNICEKPYWSSVCNLITKKQNKLKKLMQVIWTETIIDPEKYDLILISTPWVCALGIPPLPNAIGIIYDMVPNLIACGVLGLPYYVNIYKFAYEHNIGYDYYLKYVKKISCISNSTKLDFLKLYKIQEHNNQIVVDIPFSTNNESCYPRHENPRKIILVNILDWRKNLLGAEKVLILAASKGPLEVTVVGEERISHKEALDFMHRVSKAGIKVEWFRNPSNDLLKEKYENASALLFPSFYEGLGLPVLEAQSFGTPAVTSNNSSIVEINMNKNLCFNTEDYTGMANSLLEIFENNSKIKSGINLQELLNKFISENHQPENLFTF